MSTRLNNLVDVTDNIAREHGLTDDEYKMIVDHLGRTPNMT